MQERFEKTMIYLIVTLVFYYGVPIFMASVNAPEQIYKSWPLIDICVALVVNFFYGKKNGGDWLMPFESAAAFIPAIYMLYYYTRTAWIFVPIIAIASLFSLFIGTVFKNRFIK